MSKYLEIAFWVGVGIAIFGDGKASLGGVVLIIATLYLASK